MNEPDHYRVLGVSPQAPKAEIQAAYRRRLRETHPDKGGDEAEFHLVQGAWETLSHPGRRREYDLLRFGRRAARRYGKAAAKPAHRKVRGWNVAPTPPPAAQGFPAEGALVAVPWHARLRLARPVYRPSSWIAGAASAILAAVWVFCGLGYLGQALASDSWLFLALAIPVTLAIAMIVFVQTSRAFRRRPETSPNAPTGRLVLAFLVAAAVVWLAGLSTPWGWALGVYVLTGAALAWTVKRLRYTLALRRSVGGALRQFNAFGPAGTRPKADRATGKLLREVLSNLPAARLFVALPAEPDTRVPHAIVCGDRIALLCAPVGRDNADVDSVNLPEAVRALDEALPDATVQGWVLWPTLPETARAGETAAVHDVAVSQAAADIGLWLAAGGAVYDLPVLQALRMRLATVPPQPSGDRAPVVRA
ncbi:DnaJ domain-containing protein [Glycomyces sp. TRM65418]|uniref:DnaJ domain-containing protein n=1 Tax=Glycomyces sp. TRM65418 TaxID=2867006 RepID=UPI001CE4F0CB|nr:DnaJ domain-containing protein [Glycomyces sp. TRM65418]MCC3763238.1 DnaJ domain-containing protein [Glycomyces sp. TRM65418]QZD57240.1 DnaJ domain-containing protein [Glycomyces sp. TRM65418]